MLCMGMHTAIRKSKIYEYPFPSGTMGMRKRERKKMAEIEEANK